jgi:hypothetical protein
MSPQPSDLGSHASCVLDKDRLPGFVLQRASNHTYSVLGSGSRAISFEMWATASRIPRRFSSCSCHGSTNWGGRTTEIVFSEESVRSAHAQPSGAQSAERTDVGFGSKAGVSYAALPDTHHTHRGFGHSIRRNLELAVAKSAEPRRQCSLYYAE